MLVKEESPMERNRKIKVLIANPGLDVHDAGARYVAQILRDTGMEVIYIGIRQTAEAIVNAAIQESVDIIGLSILSGKHTTIVPQVQELLNKKGIDDIQMVVGGIIPREDIDILKTSGVREVFLPGTPSKKIVESVKSLVSRLPPPKGVA
jgi:methylmalonyl-CoA mutase C-terminal domain/subunit